mmetsp:Transcript_11328/g.26085  ORF Transcript_11328/g.26085 Transcript_11328/m.26085 type:complete len:293 (-) Transcript_11328:26-904(-)
MAGLGRLAKAAAWFLLLPLCSPDRLHAAAKDPVPPRTEMKHQCSRVLSRKVRKAVEKEVVRLAAKAGLDTWPAGCPFDPQLDLYGSHEKQKQRKRPGSTSAQWTCGFCGKIFKSEHYLDLHMETKHMNETPANGACLADYCEIFELCDPPQSSKSSKDAAGDDGCSPALLAEAKTRCEDALMQCFPLQQEASRKVHAQLSKHFCQSLDCRIRAEKKREHDLVMVPVIVLLVFVLLVCFLFFSAVVCCVDYSDDILLWMKDSGLASASSVKKIMKGRDTVRATAGLSDRTKHI